jgi:hypothetical protein
MGAEHFAMVLTLVAGVCSQSADLGKYLQNGQLAERLVVQDAQSGVVGRAGTEIAVDPDGTWIKTQFWGEKRRQELQRGKLSSEELAKLARVLAEHKASQLPREFGKTSANANPNPHYLVFAFGKERSELALPPRTNVREFLLTADNEIQDPLRRLDAIVGEVKKIAPEKP